MDYRAISAKVNGRQVIRVFILIFLLLQQAEKKDGLPEKEAIFLYCCF
jgi:hypothetical protein